MDSEVVVTVDEAQATNGLPKVTELAEQAPTDAKLSDIVQEDRPPSDYVPIRRSDFSFTFDYQPRSNFNPFATALNQKLASSLANHTNPILASRVLALKREDMQNSPEQQEKAISDNDTSHSHHGWSKTRIWPLTPDALNSLSGKTRSDLHPSPGSQQNTSFSSIQYRSGFCSEQSNTASSFTSMRDQIEYQDEDDDSSDNTSFKSSPELRNGVAIKNHLQGKAAEIQGSTQSDAPPKDSDKTAFHHCRPGVEVPALVNNLQARYHIQEINSKHRPNDDALEAMLDLIPGYRSATNPRYSTSRIQEAMNAPLFTAGVQTFFDAHSETQGQGKSHFGQYGLLGLHQKDGGTDKLGYPFNRPQTPSREDLVFTNMNTPWSAFICGSQGAGKSHTLSCLLENALLNTDKLGKLPDPLAGIVFHYDRFSSEKTTQICEAAYLCSSGIPVTVLVSPSNIWSMKRMYRSMPGLPLNAPQPKVLPLYLTEKQLDISRMMKLMAFDPSGNKNPLYMEVVMNILREMAMAGHGKDGFSYSAFRQKLQGTHWIKGQQGPLNMRLSLLESFMAPSTTTASTRPAAAHEDIWDFPQGSVTIIDLSDPFVDENDACALFSICLSVFLEQRASCGRVIALDEAHKFLTMSGEAKALTESLTSVIREQRHTGTRVFIATQEPTLSPSLIDLANVTIVHRFLSPAWYDVLRQHLAGVKKQHGSIDDRLFEAIVTLETGQALLFCPTALINMDISMPDLIKPLGNSYAKIRIRSRVTADGGKSVLASDRHMPNQLHDPTTVPMHVVKAIPTNPPFPKQKPAGHASKPGATQTQTQAPQRQTNTTQAVDKRTSVQARVKSVHACDDTQLHAAVRSHMRERFTNGNWRAIQNVSWRKLWLAVEASLNLKPGYITGSGKISACHTIAVHELNTCRARDG